MTFKEILEKYGITASELSRRCGVSTSTLSTFVNGRSKCQNMQRNRDPQTMDEVAAGEDGHSDVSEDTE